MNDIHIFHKLAEETVRSEKIYPIWPEDIIHAVAIISEGAGELIKSANDYRWHGGSKGKDKLIKDATELGAVVVRLLKNLIQNGE